MLGWLVIPSARDGSVVKSASRLWDVCSAAVGAHCWVGFVVGGGEDRWVMFAVSAAPVGHQLALSRSAAAVVLVRCRTVLGQVALPEVADLSSAVLDVATAVAAVAEARSHTERVSYRGEPASCKRDAESVSVCSRNTARPSDHCATTCISTLLQNALRQ